MTDVNQVVDDAGVPPATTSPFVAKLIHFDPFRNVATYSPKNDP